MTILFVCDVCYGSVDADDVPLAWDYDRDGPICLECRKARKKRLSRKVTPAQWKRHLITYEKAYNTLFNLDVGGHLPLTEDEGDAMISIHEKLRRSASGTAPERDQPLRDLPADREAADDADPGEFAWRGE